MSETAGAIEPDVSTRKRSRGLAVAAERIEALRRKLGWTQQQAADAVHVSMRQWQRWETGEQPIAGAAWELLTIKANVPMTWEPSTPTTTPQ